MKEYEGLINYLTNIILRPHRQTYGIQKLGPSKIVVKSNQKSILMLESMSKNQKRPPKQMQSNYCELIEVNRKQATIKRQGQNIQVSIYEPQLTSLKNKNTEDYKITKQKANKNQQGIDFGQKKCFNEVKYENCVIFLHANSGSRLEGIQYAKHVLQYRTLCVSFDYTGSGISQGQYTTMGVNESKDLSSVINYIAETYKVKKFSFWGRSMGAVTGIYYLLTKYKEDANKIRVCSCVIDSPFSHLQQLIKEIASKKSSLPQFVFQPVLKIIENDIINKIGINIFTELNLIQKIKGLPFQDTKLINSVSFLGLASKNDSMINYQHCQELCSLLISENVRRSELYDQNNFFGVNSFDKHLMMLVDFKKQLNTKGDFVQIQGQHNKPRSNEVKQKISFFIQDNFFSFKDFQYPFVNLEKNPQKQAPITFSKTGVSIKTKLSFAKNALIKPRKDSTTNNELLNEQKIKQEPISGQNYNLINLKEIKAKKTKQSLSKQKQSIRNSLNKNFNFRDRKDNNQQAQVHNKSIESGRGIKVVSKEYHKERINKNQQSSKVSKKAYETLQNSKLFTNQLQSKKKKIFQENSNFNNFLAKLKAENVTKNQNQGKNQKLQNSNIYSNQSGSVNNSFKKQAQETIQNSRKQIIVTPLELHQNNQALILHSNQNLTQRPTRTERTFGNLPSQRMVRNNRTQPDVIENAINQSVDTSPFNLSVQNRSNMSISLKQSQQDPFRKKDTSIIMQETDLSKKKQALKTPQVKISISQFRGRNDDGQIKSVNKYFEHQKMALKKQNNSMESNTTVNWSQQSNSMNILQSPQSVCSSDMISSQNSIQFRKRQAAETNSIHNSDLSCQDFFQQFRGQHPNGTNNRSFLQKRPYETSNNKNAFNNTLKYPQNYTNNNHFNTNVKNHNVSVSSSFSCQSTATVHPVSLKQMMINNGHKGLTQSTTFNYTQPNTFYQPIYPNQQVFDQKYYQNNYPLQQQSYINNNENAQYFFQGQNNEFQQINHTKSMKTSQDPINNGEEFSRPKQYLNNKVTMSAIQTNGYQPHNYQNQQHTSYTMSNTSPNFWYVPQQGVKQTIEYKKKINKLLD